MFVHSLVVLMLLGVSNAQTEAPTPVDETQTEVPTLETETPAPSTSAPDPPTTAAPTTTEAPTTTAAPTTTEAPTTLLPPTTTPPPPDSLSVVCTNEKITVYLDLTIHKNLALDEVTLLDDSCKLSDLGGNNATTLWMEVPFDRCQTNHSTVGDTITYQNSLITETKSSDGSSLISREFLAEFPFKCSYPRSAVLSVVSFSPRERIIYTKTAEFGNFTFTMDMYETDKYESPYDSYPVNLDLGDPMYLEVKVTANDSELVLIPLKCWGTPTADLDNDKYYVFIEDGCKNTDDATIIFDYKENSVQRFQLGAFRFVGEPLDTDVYLHCDVEACRAGDSESRCAKGCENPSSRKRRSLYSDVAKPQHVSIGPIKRASSKVAASAENSMNSLTVFAAVAGVLGVIVLALAVALVMLYRRYRTPQNAAKVVYVKAANDEGKLLV